MSDDNIVLFPKFFEDRTLPALPLRCDWQNTAPAITAELSTFIVFCWINGQAITRADLEIIAADREREGAGWVPAHLIHEHFDEGLSAAKFIAHTTNLKIPKAESRLFTEEEIHEFYSR